MVRILVVEDDEKLNQIICAYLTQNDYQAKGCLNPIEAYDLLFAENYDLIISDIMMPKVDGFDFAKQIREKDGSITKSVGWDIPDIGSPAHIEELQKEILIVGIPVTLTAKSFDFVVDALDLPR